MRRLKNLSIDLTFFSLDGTYIAVTSCHVVREESPEHGISRAGGVEAYDCTNS